MKMERTSLYMHKLLHIHTIPTDLGLHYGNLGTAEKTTEINMLVHTNVTDARMSQKRKDQLQAKNKYTKDDPYWFIADMYAFLHKTSCTSEKREREKKNHPTWLHIQLLSRKSLSWQWSLIHITKWLWASIDLKGCFEDNYNRENHFW